MNIKELLLVVGLALVTTWSIDYFMGWNKKSEPAAHVEPKAGQSFVAPKNTQSLRPLNTEVDFSQAKRPSAPTLTEINTAHSLYVFSTDGACLERLEHKRTHKECPSEITTIFPGAQSDKAKRCFLVALNKDTPYYYTLISNDVKESHVELTYKGENDAVLITKKFTVFNDTDKIDLDVTIAPKNGQSVEARILYPAPLMPALKAVDVTSALYNAENGAITITPRAKLNADMYWVAPTFFGLEDKYFVHAMIGDSAHFVQRAYYSLEGQGDMHAILEGPAVSQETSWNLSFYFGPKEAPLMRAVDTRLESTLGYAGWFAPIAYWLLKLLNFLYSYLGNYGWAIIALTVLTKIILLPFSITGARSMKKNAEMQRKLKYIQQKYKDDSEGLMRERAELMRKEGLGGLSGCLPLLLQLPIFFALSRVLSTSIELYQAPFCWISDLSAADPYYILPLLVVASMLLQATTVDAAQRVQLIVMALVFGAFTASLSAGLCLYIFISTILGVGQTIIQKRFKVA